MFLRGCPLKTVSPSGTICHAPGVLGAGDRYFLQGAAPFHFLRVPFKEPASPLFIFHRLREKGRHAYHLAHSSGTSPDWSTWPAWSRELTERTPVFVLPWMLMISQNRMLVFGRALSQFTCCSFSGSGPNFSKGIFPYLWW